MAHFAHIHGYITLTVIIQVTAYTSVGAGIAGEGDSVELSVGPRMF